jgi:hypothetical protein
MSAGTITDFLSELSESDGLAALREASSHKSPLIFKIDESAHPVKVLIDTFVDKKIFVIPEPRDFKIPLEKDFSIKFNIGTEVYFLKTSFKESDNRVYFDMSTKVIQLKRRKEPRYLIPKSWSQSAAIVTGSNEQIRCTVADISNSGIRFEILEPHPEFTRDDLIKIKFQIHKRGEVQTAATVKFVLNRPNAPTLLGLEFHELANSNQNRVTGVVHDIRMSMTAVKS